MNYLFDSNLCIVFVNGTASVRAKNTLIQGRALGDQFFVSTIVIHELWFGIAKSRRIHDNVRNLRKFLAGPINVIGLDADDARISGEIRAQLASRGTPIGPYDVLIAGQALARGLTLVTANTREFSRVDGLKLVDWT